MTTPPPEHDAPHVKTVLRLAAVMQRHALLFSVPLAVAAVVLGAVLRGTPGLVGALLGAVLGLAAGLVTTLVMRGTARTSRSCVTSHCSASVISNWPRHDGSIASTAAWIAGVKK